MTPETNQVTFEHTHLVTTCKAAKSGTDDLASQYSQLFSDSEQTITNTTYFGKDTKIVNHFSLITSISIPLGCI